MSRLDSVQRVWLSGYLLGSAALDATTVETPSAVSQPFVTVLYGSHSGNCEQLGKRIGDALAARGLACRTLDMLDASKNDLLETQYLLVVVSTHGEGEPPDRARPLYDLLHSRKAPKLDHLKYAVLALGDSSYEKFCETGRRFDAQLEALGAQRFYERTECDVDFHERASVWIDAVVDLLAKQRPTQASATNPLSRPTASVTTAYTRKNPFRAAVLVNQRLTARGSTKDVRHIELSIDGSGIHYEPGDALGIVPRNREPDVDALLALLPFDPETPVPVVATQMLPLREALVHQLDIGVLNRALVERYSSAIGAKELAELLLPGREQQLSGYLHGRDLLDLVTEYPVRGLDANEFAKLLRPLAPRLYSIASSPRATPDEIHLTVSVVRYESHGRVRTGVVSGALADLVGANDVALVYPHRNPAFRLPASPETPIVMIGAGTGVAPFRAFVAERAAVGAKGKNWLFFGDRSFRHDFLYQAEWLEHRKRGTLHRMDVAFSRDGAQKVYVQHRMLEHGRELYAWLQEGASIYVCGDAERMAPDVERTLRQIVQEHGALSDEQADEYLLQLQRERRYQKDVY